MSATILVLLLSAAGLPGSHPASSPASAPADPTRAQQQDLCFPPALAGSLRTFQGDGIILWTNAPVDGQAVLAHLRATRQYLQQFLPPPAPAASGASQAASLPAHPDRLVALALYADSKQYQDLWPRVAAHYGGRFGEIVTQAYSYRVFCATGYDSPEKFEARRSVLCHEFAHVWLFQNRGLISDGNWLSEGLATAVQMHFFPECANRRDFICWLDEGRMLPLKRLLDLPHLAPKDYWQAGTLAELLLLRYRDRLPEVLAAFNRGASANRIVAEALRTDFPTLSRQWAEYVRAAGRAAPGSAPASRSGGP